MARIEVHEDRVRVALTRSERLAAVRRSELLLDRAAISSAVITDDPWVWMRGVRAPGTEIPHVFAIGTYRNLAGRDFVIARRGIDAVVLDFEWGDLDPAPEFDGFARVILSTARAEELIRTLRVAP